MADDNSKVLVINAGSSSIKFALFSLHNVPEQILSGKIESIGSKDSLLIIKDKNGENDKQKVDGSSFHSATESLINWFEKQEWFKNIKAIGHRIVYGMKHTKAEVITNNLLQELNDIADYDPDHLPAEIEIIKIIQKKYSQLMQVACFDTAFHTTIPDIAKTFAIPKKYYEEGVQRYGFHGISYSYLMQQLQKKNATEANGKIILAHLGSGASLAAVKHGKCIDTSMGFTPTGGIVMSTRSGDLDPGIAWYLMQKGMDAKTFNNLINHKSGLLGISGVSSDMQQLMQHKKEDKNAALAIDIFCYQIKKYIGAYMAVLGGLDALVFSGGIGENIPAIRAQVCEDFQYAGILLNEESNSENESRISSDESKINVYVIATNEELMIAETVTNILNNNYDNTN